MKHQHKVSRLAKFLDYVLARQPDEFGLVADADGWFRIKDLLKALNEEPGWRHVRRNEIHEITLSRTGSTIDVDADRVRATERSHLFRPRIPETWPKLLYHAVRRRAYPVVIDNGVAPRPPVERIVLAEDVSMAERIGRRIDPEPVILTVNCTALLKTGAPLWQYGTRLYLTTSLPPQSFSGPPLSKIMPAQKGPPPPQVSEPPRTPGSYIVDFSAGTNAAHQRLAGGQRRRKNGKNEWKRDRKRQERRGKDRWPGE